MLVPALQAAAQMVPMRPLSKTTPLWAQPCTKPASFSEHQSLLSFPLPQVYYGSRGPITFSMKKQKVRVCREFGERS